MGLILPNGDVVIDNVEKVICKLWITVQTCETGHILEWSYRLKRENKQHLSFLLLFTH